MRPLALTSNSIPPAYDEVRVELELLIVRGLSIVAVGSGSALCENVVSAAMNVRIGDVAVA